MKWTKRYLGYEWNPRIAYECGEYRIMKTRSKNIWTGKPMSDAYQVWNIYKNGEKTDFCLTLREAKAKVETWENK